MIFSQDRDSLRRMYREAWQKRTEGTPMSPLRYLERLRQLVSGGV